MFDIEALTHSVGWLLSKYGGRLDSAKLVKLMYIADREAMKDDGASITGDDYCALDKGPAAVRLLDLIIGGGASGSADRDSGQASSRAKHQKEWDALFKKEGGDVVLLKDNPPHDWLSEFDIEVLDAVDARFHGMSAEEISEWTHDPANCPEWKNPHGGRLPITKADIMAALGFNVEYIASVLEEDAIYDAEERAWERYYSEKDSSRKI